MIPQLNTEQDPLHAFWLQFHINGNGTEWIDQGLPTPTYHEHINRGYIIAYALDGYFGTNANTAYLNDVIARFLITFRDYKPSRLLSRRPIASSLDVGTYLPKIYKLQELQALESKQTRRHAPERADSFKDIVFWAIKLFCEDLITDQGIVAYEQLEEFAIGNFIAKKDRSTLKAKCRSIWNYYSKKDWKLPKAYTKKPTGEVMATRQENIKKVHENTAIKNRNKIKTVLDDIFLQDDIKFKNGKYRVGKIAELTNMTEKTVSKYLKEMNLI